MTAETETRFGVLTRAAPFLAGASAIAIVFSIAAAQILLGLTIVCLAISRAKWRFPAIGWPALGLFAWTLVALAVSGDPATGWPQVKKFFVYAEFAAVASAIRGRKAVRATLYGIASAGALSAAWSVAQYARKVSEAAATGQDFYTYYTGSRTTGFMSHWMTFSGEMLIVLAILVAAALWEARFRWIAAGGAALVAVALAVNQTRSAWLAAVAAGIYLAIAWRPKALLALPVFAAAGYFLAPDPVRERALSIVEPHGETDSNRHRVATFRTGLEMIRANPVFGVGPDRVGKRFHEFVPPDVLPLPVGFYGHLHNVYLQLAADRGLPALGFLLWMLVALLRAVWRSPDPVARHAAVAAILATMVGGLFEYNLGNSEVLHLFLAVSALALCER
jgi:O-antigen ligase